MKFLTQENFDVAQNILDLSQNSDQRAFRIKLYSADPIPLFLAAHAFVNFGMVNAAILCLEQFKVLESVELTRQDFLDTPEEDQQILSYFGSNHFAMMLLWKKASLMYPNNSTHQENFEKTYTGVLASLKKEPAPLGSVNHVSRSASEDEKKVTFKKIATVCYFDKNTSPSSIANTIENDIRRSPVNFGR